MSSSGDGIGVRYIVRAGEALEVEVHSRNGSKATVYGVVDGGSYLSGHGRVVGRLVLRDAVAEPLTD